MRELVGIFAAVILTITTQIQRELHSSDHSMVKISLRMTINRFFGNPLCLSMDIIENRTNANGGGHPKDQTTAQVWSGIG